LGVTGGGGGVAKRINLLRRGEGFLYGGKKKRFGERREKDVLKRPGPSS